MKRLYVSDIEIIARERDAHDRPDNPNRHDRPKTREQLIAAAVEELRETDWLWSDFRVLERLRDRLGGEEREVLERVLAIVEPRRTP
jgi:hypothetical protein